MYGVFAVSCVIEMDISLYNPGFLLDVSDQVDVHQADHHPREKLLVVPVRGVMAG